MSFPPDSALYSEETNASSPLFQKNAPIPSGFEYPKLNLRINSFRLLRVLPPLIATDPVRCELMTAHQDEYRGRYVAGSYVWGPQFPQREIFVNDIPFRVRNNLYLFLSSYRAIARSEWLWIDAICINQSSLHERSHQVQMMGRIYKHASCVYSWLGPLSPVIGRLFDEIERAQIFMSHYGGSKEDPPKAYHIQQLIKPHDLRRITHGLTGLSQNDYWKRIWIVQEFVLAPKIQLICGTCVLDWDQIELYLALFPAQLKSMSFSRKACRNTFESLWTAHHSKMCTIPHDKVYALFGMIDGRLEKGSTIPIVNYRQNLRNLLDQILKSCQIWDRKKFISSFWSEFYLSYDIFDTPALYSVGRLQMQNDMDRCSSHKSNERPFGSGGPCIPLEHLTVYTKHNSKTIKIEAAPLPPPFEWLEIKVPGVKSKQALDTSIPHFRSELTFLVLALPWTWPRNLYRCNVRLKQPSEDLKIVAFDVGDSPAKTKQLHILGVEFNNWSKIIKSHPDWPFICQRLQRFIFDSRILSDHDSFFKPVSGSPYSNLYPQRYSYCHPVLQTRALSSLSVIMATQPLKMKMKITGQSPARNSKMQLKPEIWLKSLPEHRRIVTINDQLVVRDYVVSLLAKAGLEVDSGQTDQRDRLGTSHQSTTLFGNNFVPGFDILRRMQVIALSILRWNYY